MKIVYCIIDHAYKRVFESFKEHNGIEQFLICKKPSITTNIVPESYNECGIKRKLFINNEIGIQKYVNSIKPDVYVQPEVSPIHNKIKFPKNCKRVYVSHGIVIPRMTETAISLNLMEQFKKDWGGLDLYCGVTDYFKHWISSLGIPEDKILLNAFPQLDLLYDSTYYSEYRNRVVKSTKNVSAEKVILFFGSRFGSRKDYLPYNKDYFDTLFELEKIAKKYNWVVLVKPKHGFEKMMRFLKAREDSWGGWTKEYATKYSKIRSSKYLHFITTNTHPYHYFFADVIVSTGVSTVEVDSSAAEKPLVTYRPSSRDPKYPDPMRSIEFDAVFNTEDIRDLESKIFLALKDADFSNRQRKYLKSIGITHDGLMYKRIIDRMVAQWK